MNEWKEMLGFPCEDRDWIQKLLLGSVITIIPGVNILALGYFLICLDYGAQGRHRLPKWERWGDLFREGLGVLVILLIYLSIPLLIGFMISFLPVVGIVLSSMILLIVGMIIPMCIAAFAVHRNIKDAFNLPGICRRTYRVVNEYALAYFAAILFTALGLSLLLAVPFLGFFGAAMIFYTGVVFSNFLGSLYAG